MNSRPHSPRLATVSDGSSMRHIAPSADSDDVGREQLRVLPHEGVEMAAADLFLALEHELDVDRQARRPVAKNASATAIGISIGPLSSETPRA